MVWLHTLGGAVLYDEAGSPITRAAAHRRTLALLAALAVAGDKGLSRDRLVGLFWPDVAPRRARHSLTQALYAARKACRRDNLFQVGEDIRLQQEEIGSDVAMFEARLKSGDDAGASALYEGPFLDGFYLPGMEFDLWLSRERTRLEDLAAGALQRLTSEAEHARSWRAAVEWLRRLSVIRPTDADIALRLMRALGESGNRAAALEHADAHIRFVREQYEMEADAAVAQLAEELRDSAGEEIVAESAPVPAAIARTAAGRVAFSTAAGASEAPGHLPANIAQTRTIRRLSSALLLATITLAVLAGVLVVRHFSGGAANEPLQQNVLVAPFRVVAADPALEYLRDGLIELLSTRLADDTASGAVDAGAVLRAWRRAGMAGKVEVPLASTVAIARRLGAKQIVVGNVVGTPRHLIVSASVIAVANGNVIANATVTGSTDTLTALVDQLAARLLLTQAGQAETLARRTSVSLPALRSYLAGVQAYARGDYRLALQRYETALQRDSTFALAALRLALAADRLGEFELRRTALDAAWRAQDDLIERDRAHLYALVGPRYPAASTRLEVAAAWNRAAHLLPDRPEVWFGLAAHAWQSRRGQSGNLEEDDVVASLRRALSLDPGYAQAFMLLGRARGSEIGIAREPDSLQPGVRTAFLDWWQAAVSRDTTMQLSLADSLPKFGPSNLRALALASQFSGLRPQDGARALTILSQRAATMREAFGLFIAEHSAAVNGGRNIEALQLTRRMKRLSPATRAHLRLRILDELYAEGDSAVALAAVDDLAASANEMLPASSADHCVVAQWQLQHGNLGRARASIASLRAATNYAPIDVGVQPPVCLTLLDAWLAVAERRIDARAQLQALDSLSLTGAAAGDAAAYAHIAIARLYQALREPTLALAAVQRRPYANAVWPRYRAAALRLEAELAELVGQTTTAVAAYERFLALRSNSEPAARAEADSIRHKLAVIKPQ